MASVPTPSSGTLHYLDITSKSTMVGVFYTLEIENSRNLSCLFPPAHHGTQAKLRVNISIYKTYLQRRKAEHRVG
jgi:hypothetical protein